MMSDETVKFRPFGWYGIELKVPPCWELCAYERNALKGHQPWIMEQCFVSSFAGTGYEKHSVICRSGTKPVPVDSHQQAVFRV